MTELLSLSVAIFAGLMMTRVMSLWKLPDVTAYLVAGVLIGPSLIGALGIPGLGFKSFEELEGLGLISDVALGFIAFSIGNEFRLSQLRETGKQATVIGILQAVVATALVDLVLIVFHFLAPQTLSLSAAITLGAIAAATAPAATLMVVRQYKAKGPLTDLLLPIVALDDAVGLVLFAVSFGIAEALGSGSVDFYSVALNPLLEILGSLGLGAAAGWVLTRLEALFHSNRNRVAMTIGFVFLTVALSKVDIPLGKAEMGFSPLLVCMMLGSVFCNLCPLSDEIMERADKWSSPVVLPPDGALLRALRRGAGAGRLPQAELGDHRPDLHSQPLPGQVLRRPGIRPDDALPAQGGQVPGHHPLAPGRRGPGHVRHREGAGQRRRRPGPQHRALRCAGI